MSVDDPCPGQGKCHGCLSWCDECGDVDTVCNAERCDRHRCMKCHALLARDEHEFNYQDSNDWGGWCFECTVRLYMEVAMGCGRDEIAAGEERRRDIERFLAGRAGIGIRR